MRSLHNTARGENWDKLKPSPYSSSKQTSVWRVWAIPRNIIHQKVRNKKKKDYWFQRQKCYSTKGFEQIIGYITYIQLLFKACSCYLMFSEPKRGLK